MPFKFIESRFETLNINAQNILPFYHNNDFLKIDLICHVIPSPLRFHSLIPGKLLLQGFIDGIYRHIQFSKIVLSRIYTHY
jgi:hypothetical protein